MEYLVILFGVLGTMFLLLDGKTITSLFHNGNWRQWWPF